MARNSLLESFIYRSDSYKYVHWMMFPPPPTIITDATSYLEARGTKTGFTEMVDFGGQYVCKENLEGNVFTLNEVADLDNILKAHFNPGWDGKSEVKNFFNKRGFESLYNKYGGSLPLRIRTVPEGTVLPLSNMLLEVTSTDPEFEWLGDFLEPILEKVWFGCTVATYSREFLKMLLKWYKKNGTGPVERLLYMLHNFGSRSCVTEDHVPYAAAAHLINFLGSDSPIAIPFLRKYYGSDIYNICHSVPASEHLIPMIWGKDKEAQLYKYLQEVFPGYIHSSVIDTWDYKKAIDIYKDIIPNIITNNTTGGSTVLRPDTDINEFADMFELLFETFGGYETNRKGYKVPLLGTKLLCGSSVNINTADLLLAEMDRRGISMDGLGCFGMGTSLVQDHNRDEHMFAYKGCSVKINGVQTDLYKEPATQSFKKSKRGKLLVVNDNGVIRTLSSSLLSKEVFESRKADDIMEDLFINGQIIKESTFAQIRERAKVNLN